MAEDNPELQAALRALDHELEVRNQWTLPFNLLTES
jgi:hypothetical protein